MLSAARLRWLREREIRAERRTTLAEVESDLRQVNSAIAAQLATGSAGREGETLLKQRAFLRNQRTMLTARMRLSFAGFLFRWLGGAAALAMFAYAFGWL